MADKDDILAQAVENDPNYQERITQIKAYDVIDSKFGFDRYTGKDEKKGFLMNLQPAELVDEQTKVVTSCVDFYFISDMDERFKVSFPFRPYFYIATRDGSEFAVSSYLTKKYGNMLTVEHVDKEDLDLKNHLSGVKKTYIKMTFASSIELNKVKKDLMSLIRKNKERMKKESQYVTYLANNMGGSKVEADGDVLSDIIDIREYDVPFHMRVSIDLKIFVGLWYDIRGTGPDRGPVIKRKDLAFFHAKPKVLAFDIETTKLPLKFPDRETDEIMMISYMVDGYGFLIINREIVSADIQPFEYTPKPEYKGEFTVWNEPDELALIRKFFDHFLEIRPNIVVTYNGDFFDWPFVEARARIRGLDMLQEIGFSKDAAEEYKSRNCIHMDAFRWVKRDSYLPVGSQNLKAVTRAKLRYDPVEVEPELMCKMAREEPQHLANYSVSDAVSTYYLYIKYVHQFIFALCTIIPLGADDVLRKGSGTLCEALLMVEAFHTNIIFPNKYTGPDEAKVSKDGHRIESETYVGGHVEALEAGVFRADVPTRFRLSSPHLTQLKNEVEETLRKELAREFEVTLDQVVDFQEKCDEVKKQFDLMIEHPVRNENPRIYHLDVGAMYPNIILTNRLQPCAMVDEEICMGCSYNKPDAECKRTMSWEWRGELYPATRGEYQQILQQLEGETFGKPPKPFHLLDKAQRQEIESKRVKDYSRRVYGKSHVTRLEMRETTICQRENHFYVETVKAFRDRRYEYKEMLKKSKGKHDEAAEKKDLATMTNAKLEMVLYESLQLAHKCILNSFYGYVMRKGSRWYSMEMAGIVCHTGANIIKEARKLVDHIGKPLELDTDGIWCLIPSAFPEDVKFKLQNHKRATVSISYPGAMLNALVNESFTNHQYHTLQPDGSYTISSENSIYFEVDGPYQCMVLPASKEEGKKLKKRYAVFNLDGSLAELKGFELKRRGELNIIKHFQSSVFKNFLKGVTLEEAYKCVASDADHWLDILYSKGEDLSDEELFDLISENRSMSRKLEDYGAQKSTSISTAKRLAEFLGDEMIKDAGLACLFIISKYPIGAPVTERAIPVAIFKAEPKVRVHYLRRWTKQSTVSDDTDIRDILDWEYYLERLGNCIQKIITIPAALQGVHNPVPRVAHPDWLAAKIRNKVDEFKQPKITDLFSRCARPAPAPPNENGKRGRSAEAAEDAPEIIHEDDAQGANKENCAAKRSKTETKKNQKEPEILEKKTLGKDGFDEWLAFMKKKWKIQKKQRQEQLADRSANSASAIVDDVRQAESDKTWQILSVEPTRDASFYNLWVTINGQMNKLSLKINRAILVDCKNPREGRETVRRVLPHHTPSHFLYEYKADEAQLNNLLDRLHAETCCASILGVYESNIPPMFNLLLSLGSVIRPITSPVNNNYCVESFRPLSLLNDQVAYLPETPRTIFLYKFSQDTRHIWSLIDPNTSTGYYFVVNKGDLQMPNVDVLYSTAFKKIQDTQERPELITAKSSVKFTTKLFKTAAECEKELGKVLRSCREVTSKATYLLLLSDSESASLIRKVPNTSLFPHIKLHVKEPSSLLNQIDWQRLVAMRVVQNFFNSFIYLEDYLEWSRYLRIPLGNVPEDQSIFALDLLYARHLKKTGHALWASPTCYPDLGGKELDDLRLTVDWEPLSADSTVLLNRESYSPKACVELHLNAVAVTALVQRSRVLEAEGVEEAVAFDNAQALPTQSLLGNKSSLSTYDEGAAVDGTLKVLKQMLTEAVKDIAHNGNVRADEVVITVNRWLHTSAALLYDPALTRSIGVLEKKLVLLLCAECERMGARVLHATSQKLVLSTGKLTSREAESFAELLVQTLSTNPLFAALHITPGRCFDTLLWMDAYNYSGISTVISQEAPDEPPEEAVESKSVWRIVDDLPEPIRQEFDKMILAYLVTFTEKQEEMQFDDESGAAYRSDLVEKEIGHQLYKLVTKMAHTNLPSAARLVGAVCKALSCDESSQLAVENVRDNARRILDYTKLNELQDTGFSAVFLPNLFCFSCSQSSNLYLCADASWNCTTCDNKLPTATVDAMICERLNKLVTAYQLQDHFCSKCRNVRGDVLTQYCECSGTFDQTINREELLTEVRLVEKISKHHEIPGSEHVAQWILTLL